MAGEVKHTPTPWHLARHSDYTGFVSIETDQDYIADCHEKALSADEDEANAAFIVRAANSHEALVRKLTACVAALTFAINGWDESDPFIIKLRATRDGAKTQLDALAVPSVTNEAE